ncbi:MAG: hypothetical protein J1F02_10050 [Lachnospiraceae bacterium]|nr:hypothetical protein [Lachnospiraceae bacterium]
MKQQQQHSKKLTALFLVFALVLSLTNGFTAKAAGTITVTLRVEQDAQTLLSPVQITLTEEDLNKDYGIGLATDSAATLSPLRALAKYMAENRGATEETMNRYIMAEPSYYGGLYMSGISMDGQTDGSASTESLSDVYWSYAVNNTVGSVGISEAALSDSDDIVIYGLWSPYPAEDEVLYSFFEKSEYTATVNTPLSLTLKTRGSNWVPDEENPDLWNEIPYEKGVAGATITAAEYTDGNSTATEQNASLTARTDDAGTAALTFTKAGKYVLSASRKAADGIHYDISRPYAVITVAEASSQSPKVTPSAKPTAAPTAAPTASPEETPEVKAPAKPKSVSAVAKNKKDARHSAFFKKNNVRVIWKKVKNADGYRIYASRKKKKGYKKVTDVKKKSAATLTELPKNFREVYIKRKKGTWYIKVRAYKKNGKKRIYGPYSKPAKVKVKEK